MAISSKDLESLWQRYKAEAVPAGISVNQFFESNGVPYHVFEKWYKKKFQAPNVVECVVAGAPDSTSAVPTLSKQGNPSAGLSPAQTEDAVVIKYVNLGLSNGMKIEHHNLRLLRQLLLNFSSLISALPTSLVENNHEYLRSLLSCYIAVYAEYRNIDSHAFIVDQELYTDIELSKCTKEEKEK